MAGCEALMPVLLSNMTSGSLHVLPLSRDRTLAITVRA